jgi:nucleoside-diphosphate-sugar epimerase
LAIRFRRSKCFHFHTIIIASSGFLNKSNKKIADGKIKLVFDIDILAEYALNLNTTKLESLGWKAEVGIEEAYKRMIESMKERNSICNI